MDDDVDTAGVGLTRDELTAALAYVGGLGGELVDRFDLDAAESGGEPSHAAKVGGLLGGGLIVLALAADQDARRVNGRADRLKKLTRLLEKFVARFVDEEE